MKIIITGGAGFIGSNVADAYIDAGHEVIVIDNLFSGKKENLNPKVKFYQIDIRSDEARKVIEAQKPDIINHHAAQMSVPASVEDPIFDADVNVKGFLNILEASKDFGVKKVIFISSGGAIYGDAQEYPTSERAYPQPFSPYAITKAVSENYLAFYHRQYGLDYTVLRYANIYGPRQIPHGEAGVVAIFMDRLLNNNQCTLYHFNDEPKGMTRDYCFVGDVARANLLALNKGSAQAFNIGTGVATHTEDLFYGIFDAIREKQPSLPESLRKLNRGEARAGDLKRSCLNADRAFEGLGWKAETGLKQGLGLTLNWRLGR